MKTRINDAILYYVINSGFDSDGDGINDSFFENNVLSRNIVKSVSISTLEVNGVTTYKISVELNNQAHIYDHMNPTEINFNSTNDQLFDFEITL